MELTDSEFRELVTICYTECARGVLTKSDLSLEQQSLCDKELIKVGILSERVPVYPRPSWLDRIYVTEKGKAALGEEPLRALRTIGSMGSFGRSISWVHPEVLDTETGRLHQGAKEIIGGLEPCQLPEFLSHENTWIRYYAEERLRAT